MRPRLCPAMWPRTKGSWDPLPLATWSRLASGWEHPPTAKGTAHASAGITLVVLDETGRPSRSSRLHSYGRVRGRTVSRNYRSLAGFVLINAPLNNGPKGRLRVETCHLESDGNLMAPA